MSEDNRIEEIEEVRRHLRRHGIDVTDAVKRVRAAIERNRAVLEGSGGWNVGRVECDCTDWECTNLQTEMLGNGHNQSCPKYVPCVRAVELLRNMIEGIEYWASQEDGVPEELWDAYGEAHFIVRGSFPKETH